MFMQFSSPANKVLAGIVLTFAIVIGLLLPSRLNVPESQTFADDAGQYHQTAVHVAEQGFFSFDGVTPYAYREPGYSVFLGGIYKLFGIGNRTAIFLVQALALLGAALFFVTRLKYIGVSTAARNVCLALLLLFPATFHIIFFVYRECFVLSLMLLLAGATLHFHQRRSWDWAVVMGVVLALINLSYLSFLFLPIALLPLFPLYKWRWRYVLAVLVLPYALTMLWGVRNLHADGHFRLIDPDRTAVMWYVRGEQAERVTAFEAPKCLWAEYISRNWTGRSDACSFNGLMHAKWPDGKPLGNEAALAKAGQAKILAHFPNYLAFSVWEIVEFHLPYVNGWGFAYNLSAAIGSLILYVGCALGLWTLRRREFALFWLLIGYTVAVFVLTDATPRYLMPIVFCYALLASVGYTAAFARFRKHS
ncbi:MAG TPA: hypothetical protein PKV72_01815 [Candidatus Peribacteria bacterium]|nr:hypothetical protein [Candidatus Peribacteria bacterium]